MAEAGADLGRDRTSSERSEIWSWAGWRAVGAAAGDGDRRDRGDEKYVPEWDGKSAPPRTFERRVRVFELNTVIPPRRRDGRLLSRLKGHAETKTHNLDPWALEVPGGARVLLSCLRSKCDQQEALMVGTLVGELVGKLARNVGDEALDFETRCETKIRELGEAMDEPLNKHLMAHYFLEKLRVGGDADSQISTSAGNELVYEKLRDSAMACLPRVSVLRKTSTLPPSAGGGGGARRECLSRNRRRPGRAAGRGGGRAVHAVRGDQEGDPDEAADDDGEWPEDVECHAEMGSEGDLGAEEAAEHEHVLEEQLAFQTDSAAMMAQAKKARAEAEWARDFYRGGAKGGSSANTERVKKPIEPVAVVSQPVGEAELTPEEEPTFVDPRRVLITETGDELWLPSSRRNFSGTGSAIYGRAAVSAPVEWGGEGVVVRIGFLGEDVTPLISGGALMELEARIRVVRGEITAGTVGRGRLPLGGLSSGHMATSALDCGSTG
ncbi:unnamed protein product, partial [Prorocentrum cordatum]